MKIKLAYSAAPTGLEKRALIKKKDMKEGLAKEEGNQGNSGRSGKLHIPR